ncbi:MAG: hypothetical protein MUF49_28470 [Oculatellaceae cyanobacterium Prado106]|jgi:hypothetical protein|nr:hypothetical protein [Oculatellaceae cyanobacterium Prado106]
MARKTDDLTIAKIKKAYLNGEGSLSELAKRFEVGERTVKRYSSEQNWESLKLARGTVVDSAIRDRVLAAPKEFDPDSLLVTAIMDLAGDLPDAPVKSKESGAVAMARLIEVWRKFHPVTMDEAIDLILEIPGFSPQEFVKALRQRIEEKA